MYPDRLVNLPTTRGRTLPCERPAGTTKLDLLMSPNRMKSLATRALAAAVLAACLSGTAAGAELNLWVMSTTEQQQQDMRELLRPFLAAHPGVRVNVTVLNWESAWAKITAAAASGKGPDVIELGTTWVP